MFPAAAVCPHPPLLFRELSGRHDVAADLHAACLEAVDVLLAHEPDRVVVVGGAESSPGQAAGPTPVVRRYGLPAGAASEGTSLPLSLAVADRLLDEASWRGERHHVVVGLRDSLGDLMTVAGQITDSPEREVLLVMGDGSARRGDKAPGYVDERAFAFDAEIGRCLREGDAAGLLRLDPGLADELMVQGRAALQVLGGVASGEVRAKLHYENDPFGVMYFVAVWKMR